MGVYGLLAYMIAQQHREIGIRIALGARAVAILQAVGGRAIFAAGVGGVTGVVVRVAVREGGGGRAIFAAGGGGFRGVVVIAAVSRAIRGLLFGIVPLDAFSFAA